MSPLIYMTPVINNTLKVGQMVVLHLNKQCVTYLRLTAFRNTMIAILKLCLKSFQKRDIPKVAQLFIMHISFM